MATYIMLFRYTKQGIQNVKESPNRVDAAREAFRAFGVELKEFYSVMGQYDTVCIVEAPNQETMAKASLALGSLGNVCSETLRAFTEDEFRQIVADLP